MNIFKILIHKERWEIPVEYRHVYRHPKSLNEMKKAASVEHSRFIRGKRSLSNLPNAWNDIPKCSDVSTPRQIRQSQNNYRDTIRTFVMEEVD